MTQTILLHLHLRCQLVKISRQIFQSIGQVCNVMDCKRMTRPRMPTSAPRIAATTMLAISGSGQILSKAIQEAAGVERMIAVTRTPSG
jgi:hypothetical protein